MTSRERVASLIRQAADRSGLRNAEIAQRAGVSRSTLTEALRGTYRLKLETLDLIAGACGMKLEITLRRARRGYLRRKGL